MIQNKLKLVDAEEKVVLVKGFFEDTLDKYAVKKFSFVHLDCDLYEPYKICMEFFYPRMVKGGIILFDEYNDPVYTKCNLAIDEFMAGKPEKQQYIERDNQLKYYIKKE